MQEQKYLLLQTLTKTEENILMVSRLPIYMEEINC